jgi:uncharacterized protein (DUF2252 family)
MASGTTTARPPRASVHERHAHGRNLRHVVPRSSHADWSDGADRRDPVALLEEQNADRLPWLVPVRRSRMAASAFTFYRAAARLMATDLAGTPDTGLTVQTCGDAHLSNFGAYASPERELVFDLNDFDETLPGPWEWDVKRLATSIVIAGRDCGFADADCRKAARRTVSSYRDAMAGFAGMSWLDVWYAALPLERVTDIVDLNRRQTRRLAKLGRKARSKDNLRTLAKLGEEVDGRYRIRSDPPLLVPLRDLPHVVDPDALRTMVDHAFTTYRWSLPAHRRHLLDQYQPVDLALKVVGVGSVGTRCLVMLLEGRDAGDPLFLQIKEASASVLEEHLPPSTCAYAGQRVVQGQHLMQAASDIFLGWADPQSGHQFYVRQLKDWKGSFDVEGVAPDGLSAYGHVCAWALARAHARSGDPVAIAGYLGKGKVAIEALTTFAEAYADQNAADHAEFVAAIRDGRLDAREG